MREVSPAALQAMLAQTTDEVFVACLKIEHPSFVAPVRLAYNTQALNRADGIYYPYGFDLSLPDQREDQLPSVKVTVDNVDLTINEAIRTVTGKPTVTLDVVLASQPDVIEQGPFVFSLQDAQADSQTITGTLGFETDIFTQQAPGQNYLPTNSPGLFQ